MGENTKKRQWIECPYVNQEVFQLYKALSTKPTSESLETLYTYLKDDTNLLRRNDARSLFLYYIAKCNINKALKNEFLNKITDGRQDFSLFASVITECVKDLLFDFEIEQTLLSSKNVVHLLPVVNIFNQMCIASDSKKVAEVLGCILPLYDIIFDNFVQQLKADFEETYNYKNEELLSLTNQIMKQILWTFVKIPDSNINSYVLAFLDYSYRVMSFEKIALDMKTKCALIFAHCLERLPEEELTHFVYKYRPILEITNEPKNATDWVCGMNFKFASLNYSNNARVALCMALYSCISIQDQISLILSNGKCVFKAILEELLSCAVRPMKDNSDIVEITKNLLVISQSFVQIPLPLFSSVFERSLSYVYSFSDYPIDAVQKNATLLLGHVIKASCEHFKNGADMFVRHFVNKINLHERRRKIDFMTIMFLASYLKCSFLLENVEGLQEQIMQLLEDPVSSGSACEAYEQLSKENHKEVPFDVWINRWVKPALIKLNKVPLLYVPVFERILCKSFQLNQAVLSSIFPNHYMGGHREWSVLLKCLCYARNNKTTVDLNSIDSSTYWWGLIEKAKLKKFAVQRDDVIRITSLKVVVECQRTTEYYTEWEFNFLMDYYILNGSIQIPQMRKQVTSLYKKAITRYFASFDVLKKQLDCMQKKYDQTKEPAIKECMENYVRLKRCYLNFLKQFALLLIMNISPGSNFYRKNAALDLLMFIQPLIDKKVWECWWMTDDMENLKLVLMDSYEMNKKMAIAILSHFEPKKFGFDDSNYYASFFSDALLFASDIKPSKSLSAAYMFQLCCYSPVLFESGEMLQNYNQDNEMILNIIIMLTSDLLSKLSTETFGEVTEAAVNSPCYGILLCLRYLIRYRSKGVWNGIYTTTYGLIYSICRKIFDVVLPVVSNPAPEGYLPENEETEINIRDDTVKAQRVLVYAWRTVKEVTLLFSEFACQDIERGSEPVLKSIDYVEIGEYFMQIFVQAKHRGVFEQAYVGFCLLCECYWRSNQKYINSLPVTWLRRGLSLVKGEEVDDRLCSTRRSAGMPFLIMAILTTDPSLDHAAFHTTMAELTVLAEEPNEEKIEYRTHALNILRFLFRHTKLGDHVPPYIEKAAVIAVKGMQNLDWGIRNSSTLLFSALMTRLFGVQRTQDSEEVTIKNKMTVKVFCTRFPTLFNFLVDTLKAECVNNNSLVLHPILLVFSRLYPSRLEPSDTKIEEAIPYIRVCLSNSSFHTRKLAARAAVALVFPACLGQNIIRNFERIAQKRLSNNECHGLLLEVWHILKVMGLKMDLPIGKIISESVYVMENTGNKFAHHCVTLYMDVLSLLFAKYNDRVDLDTLRRILTSISRHMEEQHLNVTGKSDFESAMVNLTITILLVRLEHVETTFQAINYDFRHYMLVNKGVIMKTYCLHFMLFLNVSFNEHNLPDPPLYVFEEIQPPNAVRNVVNTLSKTTKHEFLTFIHKFMSRYLQNELERMENGSAADDCFLLNLLLLPYYPCVLTSSKDCDRQQTMDMLISFCSCDRQEITSAVITCISVLLTQIDYDSLTFLDYTKLISLLRRSAEPEAALYRRLAVCHFLVRCKFMYYAGSHAIDGELPTLKHYLILSELR
ncbi:hypothetical protein WA026_005494 [Henosepilachna vigintioctopunctata]|uniref:tRNA (32-2'-O)-methyltransferase regulator THADA n=1 Tax=Henosepilachna vigintioctopunctata TaxID=420089 RepID=A0AAW1U1Z0_9CUCU